MSEFAPERGSGSGKYRRLFELGQGGTANVSLAVARGPEGFRKLFVIKQLRSLYAQDHDFREMFMTEARLSARLNHPNVVQVYEVFEQGGTPTIAMEYIEGQTLDAVLALGEDALPLNLHLRILADVLSGLHYSHELHDLKQKPLEVVHRDVSPHNVMVSYEGVVKVLDFGIAKLAGTTVVTQAGVVKGKLRYMPPEQIAGEPVDRRADVFAVGVMLWEALSGAKLWKGLTDVAIMNRVLSGQIPEPAHARRPIPQALKDMCLRALAAERGDRYQSALELELALEDYLAASSHYVSAREVGKFMSERFEDARASVDRRVEAELGTNESSRPPRGSLPPGAAIPRRSGVVAASSAGAGVPLPRASLKLWAAGCVALGVAIVGWGLASSAGRASSVAAPARSVSVSISARPELSRISVDGVPVTNPYVARRAVDGVAHVVRIEAPGFSPEETSVHFDMDVRMVTALTPALLSASPLASSSAPPSESVSAPPSAATVMPALAPMAAPRPRATTAPPAPSVPEVLPENPCEPPFYWDVRGIKRVKDGCL